MDKVNYEYTYYTTNEAMNIMLTAERDVCECMKKHSHKDTVDVTEIAFNIGVIMSKARSNMYALLKEEEDKSYEAKEARETVEITKPNSTLLNKIGDEINNLEWWCDGGDTFVKRSSVHRILDKYKAESKE